MGTFGGNGYRDSIVVESAQECVLMCIRNEDCDLVSVTNLEFGLYCFVYKEGDYSPDTDPDAATYRKHCPSKPGINIKNSDAKKKKCGNIHKFKQCGFALE